MTAKRRRQTGCAQTVAIVDDEEGVCRSLSEIIESFHGWRCIGWYCDPRKALRELPQRNPEVVMVDIRMQQLSGVECIRELNMQLPVAKFIIVSALSEEIWVQRAVDVGASGYLLKPFKPEEVLEALQHCIAGKEYVSVPLQAEWERCKKSRFSDTPLFPELTRRQNEILRLLQEGYPHKQIADQLGVTEKTLEQHLHAIYRRLGVSSQVEAIKLLLLRQGR